MTEGRVTAPLHLPDTKESEGHPDGLEVPGKEVVVRGEVVVQGEVVVREDLLVVKELGGN